ncbi:MAG: Do family serine endopeptidase [Bacteroidota bacterium]
MKSSIKTLFISLIVSLSSIAGYHYYQASQGEESIVPVAAPQQQDSFSVFTSNPVQPALADALPESFTPAAEKSMPAVVHIKSIRRANYQTSYNSFFELFGMRPRRSSGQQMVSTGSGVIISSDGYIATNNHVIEDADQLEVTLNDNRTYIATVIGTDPSTDLGLIRIEEKDLPTVELTNSDRVRVGEWVLAVGNPFNLASTVTAGIVSAIGRDLQIIKDRSAIESFIQTDAAVNPGNSGGALVNLKGQLVGINTAISSPTGAYAGYAFAVPANIVRKVMKDLKQYGTVQRGYIGISRVLNVDGNKARELGLTVTEGVFIQGLADEGAAKKGGLKKGDVIVEVDNLKIRSDGKLGEIVGRKRPGDKVVVKVNRKGKEMIFSLELTNRYGKPEILGMPRSETLNRLGVEFSELSEQEIYRLNQYNIDGGAKISKLYAGKLRQNTDLQPGFVVLKLNGKSVNSARDLIKEIKEAKGPISLEGFFPRNGQLRKYEVEM